MDPNDNFSEERQAENQRLDALSLVYNQNSQAFLKTLSLKPDITLLDLACGKGIMTCWLAKHLSPSGHTVGIDINQDHIKLAKHEAKKKNIANVEFKMMSAYDLGQFSAKFDMIYNRFLLMHLTNPRAVIKAIYENLNPGGTVVIESSILSHCFSDPATQSFDAYIKLLKQLFAAQGKNYDIGKSLYSLLASQGFCDFKINLFQPLLINSEQKSLMLWGLKSSKSFLIQEGIAEAEEIRKLTNQLKQDIKDNTTVWAGAAVCQILGKKP